MADSDETIKLTYFEEGVEKQHYRNGRWGEVFRYNKEGADRYGDEDFEYESPLEMAIGTAKALLNQPGIDEVQVLQGGSVERVLMQEPEKNTVLDPDRPGARNNS
ncbi:hypothetical protein [Salinibacter phage M31CR41-2]|uniref:Uncharacterized protein n=2 Tax=Kairosalinivirus TaxID=2560158 RepID=A0A2I6UH67_9CAUD|nr:hypothetical protein FGG68_gp11 [Salinibacter phage M31CR41-2]YP_009639627.1 hypothetical protein FGG69_gp15 [Salinibacter phage SRUTV-1]ATU47041.1 hypothetical protein [Salinibacter phage SRUTV-1]AUO79310.1 hypothetical protein [Salinibacter phage M31CR41-2]AUO79382.1 hypothetical protein [Salinibacter virus M31CR41-3]